MIAEAFTPAELAMLRKLGPKMRKASAWWCEGRTPDDVAYALNIDTSDLAGILEALNADPRTPPTWAFPPRPADWATNAMARDAWVLEQTSPGNHRFAARDFKATMREHQRAKLGDAGRPMTAEQIAAQREALKHVKDEPKPKPHVSLVLMALMAPEVPDEVFFADERNA